MTTNQADSNVFGKEQIMKSSRFTPKEKDVLDVILQEEQRYSLEEAQQLMELFLNKEVI
ncbi:MULTISPECIES: hypothetical protein [Paenibacillus]|uniref:Uncharacterized protein n=1 Tax=Paenibacillus agri TaxID=2744309 RepID=A0A850ELK7_9BACL|nr:hypothetical protein [Paenibacillus agri]NUU61296.1 hypothetical protein [Paenibacillus agri]